MSKFEQLKRREFLKLSMGALTFAAVIGKVSLSNAEEKRRAKKDAGGASGDLALPLAKPGEGIAGSLSYQPTHDLVKDAKLKVERSGTPFEKQLCSSCIFYAKVGDKEGGEVGKCQVLPGFLVKGSGFCASWAKKPA